LPGSRFPSEVVASNVRKRRLLRGLKQDELAARMAAFGHEWTAGIVGFVERGDRAVSVDEFVGLAIALEVSAGELLDPTGPDQRDSLGLDFGGPEAMPADHAGRWVRSKATARCTWSDEEAPVSLVLRIDDPGAIEDWVADLTAPRPDTTTTREDT
jgi:transcriptional regulator with XRE-family HTH domain